MLYFDTSSQLLNEKLEDCKLNIHQSPLFPAVNTNQAPQGNLQTPKSFLEAGITMPAAPPRPPMSRLSGELNNDSATTTIEGEESLCFLKCFDKVSITDVS